MHLVELSAQAVGGFSPTARARLNVGYLVLKPPGPQVPPVAELLCALLYADGRGGDASLLAPGAKAGGAAVTFVGNDQTTYRIARQLGGPGALERLNPATSQVERVSEHAVDIAQYLRGQAQLLPRTTFEQLFCFTRAQLPTVRPKPKPPIAKTPSATQLPALKMSALQQQQVLPASDLPAAEAKAKALERELVAAKEVEALQYRVDELVSATFELEAKLKKRDALKAKVQQAKADLANAPTAERLGLPPDIIERARRYPRVVRQYQEALAKVEAERAAAERAEPDAAPRQATVWDDPRFWAGIVIGIAAVVASRFLPEPLRWLALLDIPAFGVSAFVAIRHLDERRPTARTTRQPVENHDARLRRLREEYEAEAVPMRAALDKLNRERPNVNRLAYKEERLGREDLEEAVAELIDVLGSGTSLEKRVQEAEVELLNLLNDSEFLDASTELLRLREEQDRLNAQLTEKGSFTREAREVERELERVRASISLAREPTKAGAATAKGDAAASTDSMEDPVPTLLRLGVDLFGHEPAAFLSVIKNRWVQYLSALTDKRYVEVEIDRQGGATVVDGQGKKTPAGQLPPRDVDVLYLSLKLTIAEKFNGGAAKVPIVVEDVHGAIDPGKHALFAKMIKFLGTVTQVLHVTNQPPFTQLADGAAEL